MMLISSLMIFTDSICTLFFLLNVILLLVFLAFYSLTGFSSDVGVCLDMKEGIITLLVFSFSKHWVGDDINLYRVRMCFFLFAFAFYSILSFYYNWVLNHVCHVLVFYRVTLCFGYILQIEWKELGESKHNTNLDKEYIETWLFAFVLTYKKYTSWQTSHFAFVVTQKKYTLSRKVFLPSSRYRKKYISSW